MSVKITKGAMSPNRFNGRGGWKPDCIVCHITEGSYAGAVSWLRNTASGASAHFVIGAKGEVTQLVEFKDGSWCNGTSTDPASRLYHKNALSPVVQSRRANANLYSYSIEHEGFSYKDRFGALTEAQYQATLAVMKLIIEDMQKSYGVDFIASRDYLLGHYQIDPRGKPSCPAPNQGTNFPFARLISDIKAWQTQPAKPAGTGGLTAIAGQAVATAGQMTAYIKKINPSAPDLAALYIQEGIAEGIRGDLAFALSCLETGNFMYKGSAVTADQHNYGGIGVTQNGMKGNSFPTPQIGVRAIIQRLKAYASTAAMVNSTVANARIEWIPRGIAPHVEWLGMEENSQGKGWTAGAGYGAKILTILSAIIATKPATAQATQQQTPTPANPALKPLDEIARDIIRGNWGNGQDRVTRLTAAGYDAKAVQARVNQML